MNKEHLIGKKFNRLTILEHIENRYYLCKCDCGNTKKIRIDHILNGATKSCGCLNKELAKKQILINSKNKKFKWKYHNDRLYHIWRGIIDRCINKKSKKYNRYGGRGIKVCDEWQNSFDEFYLWSINNGFDNNLYYMDCTIDRINNNGNYEPNNCRYVNQKIQQRNRSNNHLITYLGKTYCIAEWVEILNIDRNIIRKVLKNKIPIDTIFDKYKHIIYNLQ